MVENHCYIVALYKISHFVNEIYDESHYFIDNTVVFLTNVVFLCLQGFLLNNILFMQIFSSFHSLRSFVYVISIGLYAL